MAPGTSTIDPLPLGVPLLMREIDAETSPHTLFRRCVQCPDTSPSCPSCPSGESCKLQIQSCTACASTSCVADNVINPGASNGNSGSQSAAGPIAGGVIGGLVLIAVVVYLVWRFCIKKRRQEFDDNVWPDEASGVEKGGDQFSLQRDARASTHTMGSIASTVYTRASNIIQIAYIPGVTNRSVESSPDLIPPVPPIPAASPGSSVLSSPHIPGHDQHFFMPIDLRDSTYSGYTDRTSMARNSVATTMYRNAIVDPVPARTATIGKAVPVSVKSSSKSSPTHLSRSSTPPMPTTTITHPRQAPVQLNTKSSIVGRMATPKAVTLVKNSSSSSTPTPDNVYELSGSERSETPLIRLPDRQLQNASPQHSNDSSTFDDGSSDDDDDSSRRAARKLVTGKSQSDSPRVTQDDSPISPVNGVPFEATSLLRPASHSGQSSSKVGSKHKHKKSSSLNQIIEEATRRAMREPRHGGLGSVKKADHDEAGPFSDEHVAGTP
ncbi:hypothetical protein MMC19_006477 [Ptychographa xylographoides]|nr:hypothetical protein [Ptychographa xylographoides]